MAISQLELNSIGKFIAQFENKISYMYCDSKGYVTVGVGTMLPNIEFAAKIPFRKTITLDATENTSQVRQATHQEITEEFNRVKNMFKSNHIHNYYYDSKNH